ncbi:hypothetical protein FGO68_gene17677 [Halteria grandinella]|uniref:Uncharacterized protein n=1 Tax=Halteria grandinella TaxID=5974 RepID=A0A8J8P5U7_HALGN|nr:hypothetical protein FGO68_gene17677 [Halteria grandinella]
MNSNRGGSVEPPIFSQPLQVTYQQLLLSKTKIEDELSQTQKQVSITNVIFQIASSQRRRIPQEDSLVRAAN